MDNASLPTPQQMKRLPHKAINLLWSALHTIGIGQITIDENALIAKARKQTGLQDFGDDDFIEPMRRMIEALQHDSQTNPLGDFFTHQNLLRLLKNRLLAEDYFKRFPEILQRDMAPPMAVVGLARSGTTRTHRLLACDDQFLHLKSWESVYPAPFADSFRAKRDPRHVEIDYGLRAVNYMMPHMKSVHPMGVDEVEEEVGLIQHGFVTSLFAAMNIVPSYFAWYLEQSADASYAYMVKLLKLISWFRQDDPDKPWILKTPEHMVNFAPLMKCFPDARIVSTHRDPISVLSSLSSMGWSALVRDYDSIDAVALGQQWKAFQDKSIENYLATRDSGLIQDHQIVDLLYEDINQDWRTEIEKVYRHFNLNLSEQTLTAMEAWMASNQQNKHGKHRHHLEQFGFEAEQVEADYHRYRQRFQIPYSKRSAEYTQRTQGTP